MPLYGIITARLMTSPINYKLWTLLKTRTSIGVTTEFFCFCFLKPCLCQIFSFITCDRQLYLKVKTKQNSEINRPTSAPSPPPPGHQTICNPTLQSDVPFHVAIKVLTRFQTWSSKYSNRLSWWSASCQSLNLKFELNKNKNATLCSHL